MDNKKIKVGNLSIKDADSIESYISPEDRAMDKRVNAAVKSAIKNTQCM